MTDNIPLAVFLAVVLTPIFILHYRDFTKGD